MKQIAVIGFKTIERFCYWAKYKMDFELENRERKNVWINEKEPIRYIGVFDEQDLIGRHFDDYIEVDEVRLDLYRRIKPKPRTNFDKITESVKSLAEFIEKYATNCNYCPLYKLEKCDIKGWKLDKEYCKKEIIKWLQKEIDDE